MTTLSQLTQNALFNINNEERARAEKTLIERRNADPFAFLVECATELNNASVPTNVKAGLGTLLEHTIVLNTPVNKKMRGGLILIFDLKRTARDTFVACRRGRDEERCEGASSRTTDFSGFPDQVQCWPDHLEHFRH